MSATSGRVAPSPRRNLPTGRHFSAIVPTHPPRLAFRGDTQPGPLTGSWLPPALASTCVSTSRTAPVVAGGSARRTASSPAAGSPATSSRSGVVGSMSATGTPNAAASLATRSIPGARAGRLRAATRSWSSPGPGGRVSAWLIPRASRSSRSRWPKPRDDLVVLDGPSWLAAYAPPHLRDGGSGCKSNNRVDMHHKKW